MNIKTKRSFFILTTILIVSVLICVSSVYLSNALNSHITSDITLKTILIDAGHGGIDGGAFATDKTLEKDLNLQIAKKLEMMARDAGYNVVMTRKEDISIHDESADTVRKKKNSDLKNRLAILENSNVDIMVSIHQNTYEDKSVTGTQVFYSPNNEKSKTLAEAIKTSIKENHQPENNKSAKKSGKNIFLLYKARKPAVIVECGFLSNRGNTEKLKNENYQNELCKAILAGIQNWDKTN